MLHKLICMALFKGEQFDLSYTSVITNEKNKIVNEANKIMFDFFNMK